MHVTSPESSTMRVAESGYACRGSASNGVDSLWPHAKACTKRGWRRVADQAGIWSATATYTIRVDTIAPVTTDNSDALPHASFRLLLTPTDALSGVASTEYSIDGGPWQAGTSCVLRIQRRHHPAGLVSGSHTISYYSTDNADNVESVKSCQVILD